MLSSSTSYLEYQAGGGKGLVDLVNQLTLDRTLPACAASFNFNTPLSMAMFNNAVMKTSQNLQMSLWLSIKRSFKIL